MSGNFRNFAPPISGQVVFLYGKEIFMKIKDTIIEPLQRYIDGADELFRFPMTQSAREVVRHGEAAELHRQMEPFYEMLLEDSPRLDWTSRSIISDIAQIDPMFGRWASRQDLMKMARAWAVRGGGEELLTLLCCMIHSNGYEPYCGENTYEEVTEELRYQRVNGNSGSGEIYAQLHAFLNIVMSSPRYGKRKELFHLMKTHWDFLRHVYCVMTGSIIGLGFSNFVSLANNLKTAKYHPYLHLVYWFLADNADTLCAKKQQKGMEKALAALAEIMDKTDSNHDLDELCQMLFPEEVKEMLTKHPKTPYRQLETEVRVLKVENIELKVENTVLKKVHSELRQQMMVLKKEHEGLMRQAELKQDEIAYEMALQLQKAVVEDTIPFKEIEEELLALSPKLINIVWPILNEMLGGNGVWQKHFKSLRAKVRKRENEKEQPLVDNRKIYQIGSNPVYEE